MAADVRRTLLRGDGQHVLAAGAGRRAHGAIGALDAAAEQSVATTTCRFEDIADATPGATAAKLAILPCFHGAACATHAAVVPRDESITYASRFAPETRPLAIHISRAALGMSVGAGRHSREQD